jgi:uncharacterized membrane protein
MTGNKEHEDELVTWWIFYMEHLDDEVWVERKEGGGETHARARGGLSQTISIYVQGMIQTNCFDG